MEALPDDLIAALAEPAAHAGDPSSTAGVERLQTHISWIYLTPERVYKLRKAIELPFVSFATRRLRNEDCLREVELNRRLAPDVYFGVAPIRSVEGGWQVGPVGEALAAAESDGQIPEHCVVMRRLARSANALERVEAGTLSARHLEVAAERIVEFHARTAIGDFGRFARAEWLERVWRPVADSLALAAQHLADAPMRAFVKPLEASARARFDASTALLDARRRAGRIVDGHGDLHLDHFYFEDENATPLIIDCVEFREDFRCCDVASEVAFLAMDLAYRGRLDLAEHWLGHYARCADDHDLFRVVDFFIAYRAIVRGGVAAVAATEGTIAEPQRAAALRSCRQHLELAARALEVSPPGPVLAVCGLVGSGKSTVAKRIAACLEGIAISSDPTRKHLAGLAPTERGRDHPEVDLYGAEFTERVYGGLLERAEAVAESGRPVVLDATYSRRAQREALQAWATGRGVDAWLVWVRCGEVETLERLKAREARGDDPSDAGPDFYRKSVETFAEPTEWPESRMLEIATDRPGWEDRLEETLGSLKGENRS